MTTAARPRRPPMDARIRQRRIEVRKAATRRRRRLAAAAFVIMALAGGAVGLTRTPLFAITAVEVEGVGPARAREIKATAMVARGQNLISADLDAALARAEALPWVADAAIRREPPSTVVITVTPRRPVAVLAGVHGRWTVDREAVVLAQAGDQRLPTIDSTVTAVPVPGQPVDDPAVSNALALHAAVPEDVRDAMLAVEAVGPRTVRVQLALHRLDKPRGFRKGRTTWVRLGAAGDVGEQVRVLRALLSQLRRGGVSVPTEIDLRVAGNPAVIP